MATIIKNEEKDFQLNPEECNAAYHFHRYAEELFVIQQGNAQRRDIQA